MPKIWRAQWVNEGVKIRRFGFKTNPNTIQKKSVNRIPLKCIYRFIAYKSEIQNQIISLIK